MSHHKPMSPYTCFLRPNYGHLIGFASLYWAHVGIEGLQGYCKFRAHSDAHGSKFRSWEGVRGQDSSSSCERVQGLGKCEVWDPELNTGIALLNLEAQDNFTPALSVVGTHL